MRTQEWNCCIIRCLYFNLSWNSIPGFHSDCTHLCSRQQCMGVPFPSCLERLYSLVLLMIAILAGVRRYLAMALIFISLIISDDYVFLDLLVIFISCLKKYDSYPLPIFNWIFKFYFFCCCCWDVWISYIFWMLAPYLTYGLQIFYHSTGCQKSSFSTFVPG